MPPNERQARVMLTEVVDAGDPVLAAAVSQSGAQQTWAEVVAGRFGEPLAARAAAVDLDRTARLARLCRARFIIPGDEEWPQRLEDLRFVEPVQRRGGVPIGLWLRGPGHLGALLARAVAIVGSRAASPYGSGVATDLAADLAEDGVTVVSGGAYGIDAAAHRGALSVGGPTIAVLACGADVDYPKGNAGLFEQIAERHLIVSELPLSESPTRVRFLARNRLIAAATQGTVVVEAAVRSGARNTAGWAANCARHLMAVPGPVYSAMSEGPHLMIRTGQAVLVTGGTEVREMLAPMGSDLLGLPQGRGRPTDELSEPQLAVFEALPSRGWAAPGDVALRAGLPMLATLRELAALERRGLAEAGERGWRLGRPEPARATARAAPGS